MIQWVKVLATKRGNQVQCLALYMVEGEDRLPQVVGWHPYVHCGVEIPPPHTQTNKEM